MEKQKSFKRFENQRVVITASTDGIGLAIARRIAQEGAYVIISSRNEKNVNETLNKFKSEGLKANGIVCHVGIKTDREKLVKFATENFTIKIDCLISNAAVSPFAGSTIDTTEEAFDKIMDINFKSAFQLAQEFSNWIKNFGNVLFVSSFIGYNPHPPIGIYGVSKTALFGLTRALSRDMWDHANIRVNCIAPGIIKTHFSRILWEDTDTFDEIAKNITMGRAGESEEIAGPAAFLCSQDASYVTGETLVIGGGVMSHL